MIEREAAGGDNSSMGNAVMIVPSHFTPLATPPELPQLCSILAEGKVAITPLGGSLCFGGTMEVGGLDLSINPARVRGIVKSVNTCFPEILRA